MGLRLIVVPENEVVFGFFSQPQTHQICKAVYHIDSAYRMQHGSRADSASQVLDARYFFYSDEHEVRTP